ARKDIEARTGRSVLTQKNSLDFSKLIEDVADKTEDDPT
ncbi:MAG: phage antirepressor protein, partial [Sphaerochaeta sp.]